MPPSDVVSPVGMPFGMTATLCRDPLKMPADTTRLRAGSLRQPQPPQRPVLERNSLRRKNLFA